MAITIKNIQESYEYVPLSEKHGEFPFTATIKRIPPRQFTILEDKMAKINKDESISFTTGTFNWEIIKKGLVGWTNLLDESGEQINPNKNGKGEILDDSLNYLPLDLITEISGVITSISKDPDNSDIYLGNFVDESIPKTTTKTPTKTPRKAKSEKAESK